MLTVVHNQDQNPGLFYYLLAAVISRCWLTNNWQQTASTDSGISAQNWLELEIREKGTPYGTGGRKAITCDYKWSGRIIDT